MQLSLTETDVKKEKTKNEQLESELSQTKVRPIENPLPTHYICMCDDLLPLPTLMYV